MIKTLVIAVLAIFMASCSRDGLSDGQSMLLQEGMFDYSSNIGFATNNSTSSVSSTAIGPGVIRIVCSQYAYIAIGSAPVANNRNFFTASVPRFYYFDAAYKVAALNFSASSGYCTFAKMTLQ